MSKRCKYGRNRDGSCRRRASLGGTSGRGKNLDLQLRRSKRNPCAVRIEIGGRVGRINVRGKTTTVFIGIDDLDQSGLAHSITRVNRAEGGKLPFGAQSVVEDAVIAKLKAVTC